MSDLKVLTTRDLQDLIQETEGTLSELKAELERREESAQEREIANLENHFKSAELSLKTIREFLAFLLDDVKRNK